MRRTVFFIYSLIATLHVVADFTIEPYSTEDPAREACTQEIQKIDAQVQKLDVQKKKHIDLARKYQAQGDNWRYETNRIEDAHEAWGKADNERAQAIAYQLQIDRLLERKQRIYQFYPELQK